MKVVRGISQLEQSLPGAVVTIGNFDGVHRGHQHIISETIRQARELQGVSVAYTFRPHPQLALHPDSKVKLLLTYEEKLEALQALGIDTVIEEPFSREFSTISPDRFFSDFLLRKLNAQSIVVGYDFAFGKGRVGHLELLRSFCDRSGVRLTIVEPQRLDGELVSSSRIREHLLAGRIKEANHLLGKPFFYRGVVVKGEGRGRKIGFPTANLRLEEKLTLPYGVYASDAWVSGRRYPSVTNIGVRPTFEKSRQQLPSQNFNEIPALVETHLLDETLDLYGNTLEVQFLERLRAEQKFSGVQELQQQIRKDIEVVRGLLDINCHSTENE